MNATDTADTARHHASRVHAACLFDLVDVGLLPPPAESYALDIHDAAVRRLAIASGLAAAAFALAGLLLAFVAD
jgi:hypothetical protein